jgi:predicted porin
MRKILLGTTAVVTAVLVGAPMASAQEAPTVRIGGSIQAYGGYINQTASFSQPGTNFGPSALAGAPTAQNTVGTSVVPTNLGTGGAGNHARLGKFDFIAIPTVSVIVTGKLANGLTYGGNIDLVFNNESRAVLPGSTNALGTSRTAAAVDEAYVFVAHPRFGQVRFGDEDGVMGGLMNSGWITGFGTGGVFGVWENFQTRQGGNRTQTAPGGLGDNTKIVYMTPQFFGFDAGVSYAPNLGTGGQHGCVNDTNTGFCDRAYAFSGATGAGIPARGGELGVRRNEWQMALRYRGSFSGVGVAATVGYIHGGAANDLTNAGLQVRTMSDLSIWQVGAQVSYMGATLGAMYQRGDFNFFWGNPVRGDRTGEQLVLGASYTNGPITVGINYTNSLVEGGARRTFDPATGLMATGAAGRSATGALQSTNLAMMRRWGMGIGANYRLAPGLDLIAEYVHHSIRERGRDLDIGRAGVQDRMFANTFILGTRLAF